MKSRGFCRLFIVSQRNSRWLLVLGLIGLVALFTFAHATRLASTPYNPIGTSRFPWTLVFTGTLITAAYGVGLPDLPRSRLGNIGLSLTAIASATVVVSLIQTVFGSALLPRSVLFGVGLTMLPWSVLVWNLTADVSMRRVQRLVFVGRQEDASALIAELDFLADSPAEIMDVLSVKDAAQPERLVAAAGEVGADLIVMSLAAQDDPRIVAQAARLHSEGVRVRTISLFTEEYLGKLPVGELERVALLFDVGEIHRIRYQRSKRVVDVFFGLIGLPALAIVAIVVLIANLISSRGPLFFEQERVGRDGNPFTIYKFRSMNVGGPSTWTVADDDRITVAGRLLRPTHLDELPQLINILRGDLSLVGPRPEQTTYVEELREKVPFYDVRHLVRPGLTGWAQVRYAYGSDTNDALEKLQYDLYYLRRQSIATDLAIVVRTVRSVLRGSGR